MKNQRAKGERQRAKISQSSALLLLALLLPGLFAALAALEFSRGFSTHG